MPLRILEKHPERCFTIPMSGPVRSLNLSTAVGIVLYGAIRQLQAGSQELRAGGGPQDVSPPEQRPVSLEPLTNVD
jgi:tRNA C32,U32 (ribose-2'-O)-methylase TrmJ